MAGISFNSANKESAFEFIVLIYDHGFWGKLYGQSYAHEEKMKRMT